MVVPERTEDKTILVQEGAQGETMVVVLRGAEDVKIVIPEGTEGEQL